MTPRYWIPSSLGPVVFDGERAKTTPRETTAKDVTDQLAGELESIRAEYATKVALDLCTIDDDESFSKAMRARRGRVA